MSGLDSKIATNLPVPIFCRLALHVECGHCVAQPEFSGTICRPLTSKSLQTRDRQNMPEFKTWEEDFVTPIHFIFFSGFFHSET